MNGAIGHPDLTALWRIEFPRLVATATRITRDPELAEQIAQDAFVSALEQWPDQPPERPAAWLMAVTKRRAVDVVRREVTQSAKYRRMAEEAAMTPDPPVDDRVDGHLDDDVLRLMFICCHPVLGREARVALTLRLLGGLSTQEIATAQLVSEATAGQRISRAKRTVREAGIAFENPGLADQAERLSSVLEVIYLIFNEGYAASSGDSWTRTDLAGEALRLARMLSHLMPRVAEAHGLLALMEIQASRFAARVGPDGPVLLEDQDRMKWDRLLIRRGLTGLERARRLGGGPYTDQAAIAASHARAVTAEQTDWAEIARLYDAYALRHPGPVVELNRAIAHWKSEGTQAARSILEPLLTDPRVAESHLLRTVLAELAIADGRTDEARAHLHAALGLTRSGPDRIVIATKLARIESAGTDPHTTPERNIP